MSSENGFRWLSDWLESARDTLYRGSGRLRSPYYDRIDRILQTAGDGEDEREAACDEIDRILLDVIRALDIDPCVPFDWNADNRQMRKALQKIALIGVSGNLACAYDMKQVALQALRDSREGEGI